VWSHFFHNLLWAGIYVLNNKYDNGTQFRLIIYPVGPNETLKILFAKTLTKAKENFGDPMHSITFTMLYIASYRFLSLKDTIWKYGYYLGKVHMNNVHNVWE
jgi:hypothetical protein